MNVQVGMAGGGAGQAQQQFNNLQNQFNQVTTAANRTSNAVTMFGNAFKGAFIGAITGFAVRATIGNIMDLGAAIRGAGVDAVKAAADFEMTVNAMKVFAGSASLAREELRILSDLSKNTPGLRLEDAEAGAKRLRALGFAAQTTQDLVVGLAKQKILSGADEQAMNRVIVNITQLASGSPRVTQDIKEMVQSMPTLRNALIDTFGSIERFKSALARDPQGAFRKFSEGLKDVEAPAGGLNDALGKLEDAITRAGRSFGEPILEPLTEAVRALTGILDANQSMWRMWGQSVGDAIRGATDAASGFGTITGAISRGLGLNIPDSEAGLVRLGLRRGGEALTFSALNTLTFGGYGVYSGLRQAGQLQRERQESARRAASFESESDLLRQMGLPQNFIGPVSADMIGERRATADQQRRIAAAQAEAARKERIAMLERTAKETEDILDAQSRREQAILDSRIRETSAQELTYLRQSRAARVANLNDQITVTKSFYNEQIKLAEEGTAERAELESERNSKIADLNAKLLVEDLKAQKAIAEQERRILEERRQAQIEFKELQIRETRFLFDAQAAFLESQIDIFETGYDRLIDATATSNMEIARLTGERYALELQKADLTAEQRVNIERRMYLDFQELSEQNARRIADIQRRAMQDAMRRAREGFESMQRMTSVSQGGLQSLQGALGISPFFGSTLPEIGLTPAFGMRGAQSLRESVEGVGRGTISFYEAQANVLQKIHDSQKAALEREIDLNKQLIALENVRAKFELDTRNVFLQGQIDRARQTGAGDDVLAPLLAEMGVNQEMIDRIVRAGGTAATPEGKRLEGANRALELRKALLGVDQAIEANLQKQAIDLATINGQTQEILKGRRDIVLNQINELDAANAARDAAIAYRQQEVLLGNQSLVNLARETELLRAVTELRKEELDALFQIDRSNLRIGQQMVFSQNRADAAVLNFLAQQKGITEIVSDTKINLLTTAYTGLEAVADRLTRKFGAFRDVIRDLIANLMKLALNRIFGPMLGGQGGGGFGGFQIPGLGGGGGGFGFPGFGIPGMGPGGTPMFNGAAAGFGGITGFGSIALPGGGTMPVPLLGQGAAQQGSLGGLLGSGGVGSGLAGGFAALAPFLGLSLGASVGGSSISGGILGGLGGLVGGAAVATLLGGGGALGGMVGILGTLGTASLGIGLIAAPLLIAGAYFLGRDKARRRDERTRNQAMLDSLGALDKLIQAVNNDQMDGPQALEQAEQIRSQYLEAMGQLKDRKTRGIALKDVSRLDAKINDLKNAISGQAQRRERLELIVPTFAWGGPVGYQMGSGHGTSDNILNYFPAAKRWGWTSPTEYVLDAETTRNIGTHHLDTMRATKGQSYSDMRKRMTQPKMATGGSFGTTGITASDIAQAGGNINLEVSLNVGLAAESFATLIAAALRGNDGSRQQVNAIVKFLDDSGPNNQITAKLASQLRDLLK